MESNPEVVLKWNCEIQMGREGGKEQKRWGTGVTEKALFPNPAKGMCRKGGGYFPQVNDELR